MKTAIDYIGINLPLNELESVLDRIELMFRAPTKSYGTLGSKTYTADDFYNGLTMGMRFKSLNKAMNKVKANSKSMSNANPDFSLLYKPLIDAVNTSTVKSKVDCVFGFTDTDLNSVVDYKELMKL